MARLKYQAGEKEGQPLHDDVYSIFENITDADLRYQSTDNEIDTVIESLSDCLFELERLAPRARANFLRAQQGRA